MSRRIFLVSSEKMKVRTPDGLKVVHVVSGDDSTEMSLRRYLRNGGTFVDDDIFVSFIHPTPLQFRLEEPIIPIDNLVISSNKSNIYERLSNLEDARRDDYFLFGGSEVESDDKEIKKVVEKYMGELKQLTHVFIDAGYYRMDDNPGKIDDWMVTFEDPLQKLFVLNIVPETSARDMSVEDEFLVNPAFRKGITEYWMKVVSNFMINNEITSIEEVGAIGNWNDEKVWEELREMEIKL